MANNTNRKKNTVPTGSSRKSIKQMTDEELRDWYSKNAKNIEKFERAQEALQYLDPTKTNTRTFSTFSKDTLRTYMQNPLAQYKNLRNVSRFLYYRSQIYRRIINYNASMIDTNFRSVIPQMDLINGMDTQKALKSYYDTLVILDKMNLASEMLKAYTTCWIEDVFFGVYYFNPDGGGFVLQLDPDYCQITSIYPTGDFGFDFDMTYFRSHAEQLELWGEPFTSMNREYESTNQKWVAVPDEYCICFKVNTTEPTIPTPPYITLFDSIINVEDLKEITQVADEADIYKLLVAKIPLLDSDEVDDFAVDPDTAIAYYQKMIEALPDYVNAILSPIDVDSISFDDNRTNDVNKVENASKNILKTSGHSILAEATGTTAVTAAIKADEDYAISSLLIQTQAWVNRFLSYQLSDPAKVKFLEVTKYTKEAYKESLIKDMNYGLPFATTLGVLNGYSELDLISMANINNALGLNELFKPMATASTRSSEESEGGRPTSEDTDLTDEAEANRDKQDNKT